MRIITRPKYQGKKMKRKLLKVLSISLVVCGCFSKLNAASNLTPLKQTPNYEFSLSGLYLVPGASNLIYAVHTNPLPLPAPT